MSLNDCESALMPNPVFRRPNYPFLMIYWQPNLKQHAPLRLKISQCGQVVALYNMNMVLMYSLHNCTKAL